MKKEKKKKVPKGARIPRGVKIYMRRQKAQMRKSGIASGEEQRHIQELYQSFGITKSS